MLTMLNQTQGTEWPGDWGALSDQFWTAWRKGVEQVTPGASGNPAIEQWQRMMDQARNLSGASGQGEVFERGLSGVRQYVDFMQNAVRMMGAHGGTAFDPAQLMRGAFGAFDVRQNPVLSALRASAGQGTLNVDQLLDSVQQFTGPLQKSLSAALEQPAFGQHREQIERSQDLVAAFAALPEPLALYQAEMLVAARRGLEIFESKLAARAEPGRELTSLRAVYDLWIDAAEEGYAEVALSPGFRKAYGGMVNAQMRVRQLIQKDVERSTAAFGMPGRTEVDSVLRQLHDLRRRLGDAEEALALGSRTRDGNQSPQKRRPARKPKAARTRKDGPSAKAAGAASVASASKASAKSGRSKSGSGKVKDTKGAKATAAKSGSGKRAKRAKSERSQSSTGTFAERLEAVRKSARKRK